MRLPCCPMPCGAPRLGVTWEAPSTALLASCAALASYFCVPPVFPCKMKQHPQGCYEDSM